MVDTPAEVQEERGRGPLISGMIASIAVAIYFGAPVFVAGAIVGATGRLPGAVETAFLPVQWLYDNCDVYRSYIRWQENLITL